VALHHVVLPHEGFKDLDIEGHWQADGQFDADTRELRQAFLRDVLAPFLTEAHCPLVTLRNPHPQDDALPADLIIAPAPRPGRRK